LGGGILAVGYLNKRFGILDKFVGGVGSLGFKIGEATAVGLGSIPTGLATGAKNFSIASGGTGQIGSTWDIAVQNLKDNLGLSKPSDESIIPNAYGETSGNSQEQGGFAELITALEKNTPVDADYLGLMDSAAGNILKKLSWLNLKSDLKTYFDTLYGVKNPSIVALSSPTTIDSSYFRQILKTIATSISDYITFSALASKPVHQKGPFYSF